MNKLFTLVVSIFLLYGTSTALAAPLTLEDVNALKQVVTVRMSPDGARIAYLLQVPREIYVDADGGPYRDIVKAAEKCTAGVIHPGIPRDQSAKDIAKWIKRGQKFN